MDEGLSAAVRKVFVDLYRDGLIYKDKRLVNWDCQLQTAVSDLEVDPKEVDGHLWYIRYPIEGEAGRHVTVATTRPETMLGDTGVAVHPEDPRYRDLIGKHAILPLVGRRLPIVADEYSDPEKGSGAVKITPGHDFNDFEVGRRHGLAMINIMDTEGRLNAEVPEPYRGLERFVARERVLADLEAQGLIDKIEPIRHVVPFSQRSETPGRADPERPVVCGCENPRRSRRSQRSNRAAPGSCRSSGPTPTSSGCATFSPGASRASCGGAIRSRRGTGRTARSSSRWTRPRRMRWRRATTAGKSSSRATRTCSTPGSPRRCGRSRRSAGPSAPRSSPASTPTTFWSPPTTSFSSGSPA